MEKLKSLLKYQRQIIEGFFVSVLGGWAFTSLLKGSYTKINNINYVAQDKFAITIMLIMVFSGVFAFTYYKFSNVARIMMFMFIYVFFMMSACNGYSYNWNETAKNPIGNICFDAVLCFIAVLAFLYVKDDIFDIVAEFKIDKKKTNIIVAIVGILLFAFVGIITVYRYLTYSNSTFDFGIFTQMYENMKQTGSISTTLERNRVLSHFGVHFSPIFYIALPIYFIFPSPVTVQLIQAFMVALPVIPIVLISRKYKLSNWMTVGAVLLYALYPATAGGTLYDIHENCFLTFLILMAIWAIEKKKNILTAIMVLLVFFVKEDAPVYIMVLGTFYLFSRKDKKRGLILMVTSAIYFIIATSVVKSYGLGIMDNRFSNLFYDQQKGLSQLIRTVLVNPGYVISQIVANYDANGMEKIGYILLMFVPMAAVIFRNGKKYSRFILISPVIVINLLTLYVYQHDITFQYNFGSIALMMYLVIMNMADLKPKKAKVAISVAVICAGVMFMGSMAPRLNYYTSKYSQDKATYEKINIALSAVPKNASVCASGFFTPHLKNLEMYDQNHLEETKYTDYLVIDERYTDEKSKFDTVLSSGQYDLIYNESGIISIYRKK
ncbi:DUF2079 domain-containing protein [uncultured Eubacterium sp.]|uniref:DUF2079 domain-containing protein n=1 Tax=uncultured Eubacterium sp. TaxID=165185 RepID=UPI0026722D5E|nr:DUF2079 domain-containing protein [uncultured Eubacterium sp.]